MHEVSFSFLLVNLVLLSKWTSLSEVLINHLKRQHLLFTVSKFLSCLAHFQGCIWGPKEIFILDRLKKTSCCFLAKWSQQLVDQSRPDSSISSWKLWTDLCSISICYWLVVLPIVSKTSKHLITAGAGKGKKARKNHSGGSCAAVWRGNLGNKGKMVHPLLL